MWGSLPLLAAYDNNSIGGNEGVVKIYAKVSGNFGFELEKGESDSASTEKIEEKTHILVLEGQLNWVGEPAGYLEGKGQTEEDW